MDNSIFSQYLTNIESVDTASENIECIKGNFKVGETILDVSVEVKHQNDSDIVKFKAERDYNFEIFPLSCDSFNKDVLERYGVTYNIYSYKNTLYLTKKTIVEPDYGIEMICEEVFNVIEEAVKLFEKSCVNFMRKYTAEETKHSIDPELKKGDVEETIPVTVDDELTSLFYENQREVAKKSLHHLAERYAAQITQSETGTFSFETSIEDEILRVRLKKDSSDLIITYEITTSDVKGYALLSNAKATYPEYSSSYENHVFAMETMVVPDEYLPDLEKESINDLQKAFSACNKITIEEESVQDNGAVADIQKIMGDQLKDLQIKESALDEKEKSLAEQESQIREKAELFEEEKKRQVGIIQNKIKELDQREKELESQKQEFEQQKEISEKEKVQYDQQFENIVMELKRMRARTNSDGSGNASNEEKKLQMKIDSMNRSRAAMEQKLKKDIQVCQEKNRQLMRDIQDKELEITEMQNDFNMKANQMFQEERDSYKTEICELKERAGIAENDINTSSFQNFIDEKTEFGHSSIQHGKNKEIVSIETEGYLIKVVFGALLFVDVTKTFRKAVDVKTVSAMNNKYMDIKFFLNGKKVVTARKYFSIHILNDELVQIIRDLMSNFE